MCDEKKEKQKYVVKDTDGMTYDVLADEFSCGGNGLQFFYEEKRVAWFIRWANFVNADYGE